MTPATTDALLRMVDVVRTLLTSIEETGAEGDADIEVAVAAVTRCIETNGASAGLEAEAAEPAPEEPAPPAEAAVEPEPEPAPEPVAAEPVPPAAPVTPPAPRAEEHNDDDTGTSGGRRS